MAGPAAKASKGEVCFPVSQLPHEELRVMLASGHDLHVAAFASGAWNDDFVHHFIGRGIGYNLSLAVRSHV